MKYHFFRPNGGTGRFVSEEPVDKVGKLAMENDQLGSRNDELSRRCLKLEKELELALKVREEIMADAASRGSKSLPVVIEDVEDSSSSPSARERELEELVEELQIETDELHKTVRKGLKLSRGMKDIMEYFVQTSEENAQYVGNHVRNMKNDLFDIILSKEEAIFDLTEENHNLKIELAEAMKDKQMLQGTSAEENKEVYHVCDVLHREIDVLRQRLKEVSSEEEDVMKRCPRLFFVRDSLTPIPAGR